MNREAREQKETVIPNSAQIERLRAAFPEYFNEQGSFMLDRFEQMLKEDDLDLTREGYELKFLGQVPHVNQDRERGCARPRA